MGVHRGHTNFRAKTLFHGLRGEKLPSVHGYTWFHLVKHLLLRTQPF